MLETLETPVHSAEKKLVLKAIADSAGKITVADIATKTTLPVLTAGSLLNQVAYETGGHLTVGTAGNIVYEFDRNFQSAYLTKGSKDFFRRIWRVTYNGAVYLLRLFSLAMFFVIRVSFGIILVLSVVLVVVLVVAAVVAILARLMGDDNDSGPNLDLSGLFGGMGGLFRYWAFDWLWDWWYWSDYLRWNQSTGYRQVPQQTSSYQPKGGSGKRKDGESFLDKCFSFLFGDGDPNENLAERYWQTIALALKANSGVVVAEQLAPYANVEGKNEDWVLPVLVRFNGNCDVSENGNIIYNFPSFRQKILQEADGRGLHAVNSSESPAAKQSAELHELFAKHIEGQKISQQKKSMSTQLESHLREHLWQLSHVTGSARTTIICFAAFVLIGSLWLSTMIVTIPFLVPFSPLLLGMAAYGAMFLVIPGIRSLIIKKKNSKIEARNSARFSAAMRLQNADEALKKKLAEADSARRQAFVEANKEEVAYSTDKELLEQQFDNPNLDGDLNKNLEEKPEIISLKPNKQESDITLDSE